MPGAGPRAFVRQTLAIAASEAQKLRRDPAELLTRAVQPLLWSLVFGQVFSRTRGIPTGQLSYVELLAPGKVLSAGIRGLPQAIIIYPLSALLGVRLAVGPLAVVGVLLLALLAVLVAVAARLYPGLAR